MKLFLLEVVHTNPIVFAIEVIFKFSIALAGQIELSEVVSPIVPEEQETALFHRFPYFLHDLSMFFRFDSRKYKDKGVQISQSLIRNLIFDEITYFNMHSRFQILMFFHLLLYQMDGFGRNVAAVVVEAFKLP